MSDHPSLPDIASFGRALQNADAAVSTPAIALDPQRIDQLAHKRVHNRRRAAGTLAVGSLLIAGFFVAAQFGAWGNGTVSENEPTAAELLAEFNRLNQQFDSVMTTAEQVLASTEVAAGLSDERFVATWKQQTRLAQLQEELTRLEAEAEQHPADDWQLAWLRAGAKRLALANLDAQLNPDVAAESYRKLAANYAGSAISEAALRALRELPDP